MNQIRILYVVPNLRVCNGVASYAMNYFRHIDKNKIKIDFLLLNNIETPYYDEIKEAGSEITVLPSIKNGLRNYINAINKVFDANYKYDIVHSHVINVGAIILKCAKKKGVKIRILHNHATKSANNKWKKIRNDIIAPIAKYYATDYFACSKMAGDSLFKGKKYEIINNAIEINKYEFNDEIRNKVRNELNISDKFVIGCVGRITYEKNPGFVLDILTKLTEINKNVILLWVGTGNLENSIKESSQKLGINKNIIFMGDRNDVHKLYQAMDVFLLTSYYEGFGIVNIEAQVAGLPTFVSDVVPIDTKVTDLIYYLSLKIGAGEWAEKIIDNGVNKNRKRNYGFLVKENRYDIDEEANMLENKYNNMLENYKE
ncbi:MAG: glycosyltransferase family 1 protein [Clostridiaceae bacterium]